MIPYAAAGHLRQRKAHALFAHVFVFEHSPHEQNIERHRIGKLGANPESTVVIVESGQQFAIGFTQEARARRRFSPRQIQSAFNFSSNVGRLRHDFMPTITISIGYGVENRGKPRNTLTFCGREIRARKKWLLLGRQKYRERPAAITTHELHDELINVIEVGAFFPIDFDVHERLVHAPGNLRILERFTLHHVTPVTSGVSNRQEDWFVLALGSFQSFRPPWIPIDRVFRVLQQIW